MRLLKCLVMVTVLVAMTACQTVTLKAKGIRKLSSEPNYESSKSFFLGGLVGEHRVDGKKICGGKTPSQMQSQQTFLDGFLKVITLLIYSPHTVKVWCPEAGGES